MVMNILFYLHGDCRPEVGGIERVTDVLCSYFKSKGHNCFLIYQEEADPQLKRTEFNAYYFLPSNSPAQIAEIIKIEKIDIIINQEEHYVTSQIYDAVNLSGRCCKIVFAYHNTPLEAAKASVDFNKILKSYKTDHRLSDLIKLICYPIYRAYNLNSIRKQYKETLQKSNVNVMLANCFINKWYKAARVRESQRKLLAPVIAINNPLSIDSKNNVIDFHIKEKRVLILSRLYEPQKRILSALKIWRELEKDSCYDEWKLDIVGDGPDKVIYEKYASKYLKRVTFYGRQVPKPYYMRSSIYLMTSAYEGWGMTLVEAMHYGCVPIVFDSFASLHDIIQSEMSDCIIENGNNIEYLSVLKDLMNNESKRFELANICKESTKRFSVNQIGEKWITLFNSL